MSGPLFRSSLLNHWARKRQTRPPAAVVPWLTSSNDGDAPKTSWHHDSSLEESLDSLYSSGPPDFDLPLAGALNAGADHTMPPSLSSVNTSTSAKSSADFSSSSSDTSSSGSGSGSSPRSGSSRRSSGFPESYAASMLPQSPQKSPNSPQSIWAKTPSQNPRRTSLPLGLINNATMSVSARMFSALPTLPELDHDNKNRDEKPKAKEAVNPLAKSFQRLLGSCAPKIRINTNLRASRFIHHSLRSALDRACACASTPSSPFTIRRMLAPSAGTHRLADIMYRISGFSEKKRSKWLKIPAIAVAIVHGNQDFSSDVKGEINKQSIFAGGLGISPTNSSDVSTTNDREYKPLPFVPPKNAIQMEDFANTRAAVQRMMLSLSAENIGSKLASKKDEPATRTPAFRNLVMAQPTDRIAALLLIGDAPEESNP